MRKESAAWEREFRAVWQREQRFLRRYENPPEKFLDKQVEKLAPEKLIETLSAAFEKAVTLVLDKGGGVILPAGRRQARRENYQVHAYAADLRESRKSLRAFSREAVRSSWANALAAGTAGVGMGLLGMTLPDIPLLTGLLLKCVYETAESFGFPCESETERIYALRVLETALSEGEKLRCGNRELEHFDQTGIWLEPITLTEQTRMAARQLSEAALYGKALQNVPIVGVVGGAGDWECLRRVGRYAAIRYEKRFLLCRRTREG